jgi:ethanolamine ammonia-lyase small subunit
LQRAGVETFRLATAAENRHAFLLRPDLGRRLSDASRRLLQDNGPGWGPRDLAILVSDGLSALAAECQAAATLAVLLPLLRSVRWSLFPVFVVPFARVKLQDDVGEILGARHTLMLLGERPGLASTDSLGAYLTYRPRSGSTDADRNCVSNIRPEGLPPAVAARKLAHLLLESARLGVSGVALKDPGLPASPMHNPIAEA